MSGPDATDEERGDPVLPNNGMGTNDITQDASEAATKTKPILRHSSSPSITSFDSTSGRRLTSIPDENESQDAGETAAKTKPIRRQSSTLSITSFASTSGHRLALIPDESESETGSEHSSTERRRSSRAWKWYCFVVLYVVQLIGSPFFLYWLLTSAWNHESPLASALFFCAEVIAYVSSSLFLFTGLFSAKKKSGRPKNHHFRSDEEKPHLAVCLCRYKEPLEDLFVSVNCMLDIDWPADKLHLFILDDGFFYQSEEDQKKQMVKLSQAIDGSNAIRLDRPQSSFRVQRGEDLYRGDCAVESQSWTIRSADEDGDLCEVTLLARKKGKVSHFKAGNINNFLYNYLGRMTSSGEAPAMEFMLLLDHDMMVAPNVLNEAMARFEQENLAFVQYPQRFFDIVTNDRFYAGNEVFFDGVCENRSHVGLAPFAGTNAIWRLRSLYSVGGFQYGSITEDANTGFAAHRRGFTSEYIAREVCVGQSPQNLPDAMRQRMRWSQGSIEIAVQLFKSFFCRDLNMPFPCPEALEAEYSLSTPIHRSLSCGRSILLAIIYADSLIYPTYSFGFLLHVGVCLTYLINAQAPMAPSDPAHVLFFWLPLHVVKVFCQVFAFPMVSLNVQLHAQKAWAGYAISTIVSIKSALVERTSGWFNTGSRNKDRFLIQYGNTFLFAAIAVLMVYRVAAFTAIEGTCKAWMTFGALVYGFMMAWLLEMWALEPFVSVPEEAGGATGKRASNDDAILPQQSASKRYLRQRSSFSFAMREAVSTKAARQGSGRLLRLEKRLSADLSELSTCAAETGDQLRRTLKSAMAQKRIQELIAKREAYERHYPNISILLNFIAVVMVSFTLLIWATGNCDAVGNEQKEVIPNGTQESCIALWGDCIDQGSNACCGNAVCLGDGSGSACVPESLASQLTPHDNDAGDDDSWEDGLQLTHYWDCSGQSCDAPTLQPWDYSKYRAAKGYQPQDPNDFGGPIYGEKLWVTAAVKNIDMGPSDSCCGETESGGCGKCVLINNPQSINPDWTVIAMKKNTCGSCGSGPHIDVNVPGFDVLQISLANICGDPGTGLTKQESATLGQWDLDHANAKEVQGLCDQLPSDYQKGCRLFTEWGWLVGDPSNARYKVVECPQAFKDFIGDQFDEGGLPEPN